MSVSIEQFQKRLPSYSEPELKQTLLNCRGEDRYEQAVKEELNSRYPGWDKPKTRRGGSRSTIARFGNKEQEFDTARAAYIWLVERFAEANPTLFTDVRWETTGYIGIGRRKGIDGAARNYFAKSAENLFRHSPALVDSPSNFHRLTNGWFVNLNLNTHENFEILCRFSSVSGLKHFHDWDWRALETIGQLEDSRRRFQAAEIQKEYDEILAQIPSPHSIGPR